MLDRKYNVSKTNLISLSLFLSIFLKTYNNSFRIDTKWNYDDNLKHLIIYEFSIHLYMWCIHWRLQTLIAVIKMNIDEYIHLP